MDFLAAAIADKKKEAPTSQKTRLTRAEREEIEARKLQKAQQTQNERKNRKRKKMEESELDEYMIPKRVAKKLKLIDPKKYSEYVANRNKAKRVEGDNSTIGGAKKNENNVANTGLLGAHNGKDSDGKAALNIPQALTLKISEEETIRRLRNLRQPVRYFGETDEERMLRLRQLELIQHERDEGATQGSKNEFSHTIANEVEKELEAAMAKSAAMGNEYEKSLLKEKIKESKYDKARKRSDFPCREDYVLFFFKRMLREWEKKLLQRSEDERTSREGKHATMCQKQARRDIKPLFKQLKNRKVPNDVLDCSDKMVRAAEERNYMEAKRIFFQMAIGNAPWPMGVTMVGIHERSGRSKIFSSQIAHVMNDETQRKYIHAMFRLISFCQSQYPNTEHPNLNMG